MNSPSLSNAINGIFVVCAIAITAMLVRREFFPPQLQSSSVTAKSVIENWRDYQGGQPLGAPGRRVSLVVFNDYECPACRAFSLRLDTLRAKYPTQLSIYYRNYPLPYHSRARPAAFAAECAARQNRFESARRLLFANVDSIGVRPWARFGALAGIVDTSGFAACVRDSLPVSIVMRDEAAGKRLNLRATPTLLLDNVLINGGVPISELESLVESAIRTNAASKKGSS